MNTAADTLLHGNDSLRLAVEQLFLQGAQLAPLHGGDSVLQAIETATASDLYGAGSALAQSLAPVSGDPFAANTALQGFVLLLGILYALLLSNHLGNVYTLIVHTFSGSAAGRRTLDIRGGSNYTPFLNLSIVMGIFFSGVLALRTAAPQVLTNESPQLILSLAITFAVFVMLSMQTGMLKLAGTITLTQEFTKELTNVKRTSLALLSVLLPPVLLCYALTPAGNGESWVYVILAELAIVLFLFLKESLTLFVSKKISILHWFLYLCVVEVFPVSLLWLLIARH